MRDITEYYSAKVCLEGTKVELRIWDLCRGEEYK